MPNLRQVTGDPLSERNVKLVLKELEETAVAVSVVGASKQRLGELADLVSAVAGALVGERPEVTKPRTRLRQRIHDLRISNLTQASAARNIRAAASALSEVQEMLKDGIGNAALQLQVADFELLNVWGYTKQELSQVATVLEKSARALDSAEMPEAGEMGVELGRGAVFVQYLSDRDALGLDPGKSGGVADVLEAIADRLWALEFGETDYESWGGKTSRRTFSRAFAKALTGHSVDAETRARLQVTVGKIVPGFAEALEEAIAYPLGTVRQRKAGDFKKIRQGRWRRIKTGTVVLQGVVLSAGPEGVKPLVAHGTEAAVKRAREETAKLPGTISALKSLIDKGVTAQGLSIGDHIRIAKQEIREHEAAMGPLLADLREVAPHGQVSGRIKTLESTLGKVVRRHHKEKPDGSFDMSKPNVDGPDKVADISGARIVHDTIEEVNATVSKVTEYFGDRIIKVQDRITHPLDTGYRSVHFDVRDFDGKTKEIQVRTKNQQVWADWNHDFYKPVKPQQVAWRATTDAEVEVVFNDYGMKMSDYFFAVDNGRKAKKPDCPPLVRDSPFGCLEVT